MIGTTGHSVETCFADLLPALTELAKAVALAPLPPDQRAGLALMVASHSFGMASDLVGKSPTLNAREVADLIVETMRAGRPALRVVNP